MRELVIESCTGCRGRLNDPSSKRCAELRLQNRLDGRDTVEYVEDVKEKTDTPCWVGFPNESNQQGEKIRLTFEEAEAGIWVLRGWDVGYLPGGLVDAVKIEWIT